MNYHALFVIFEKQQNLKLLSAANYRWCFKGKFFCQAGLRLRSNLVLTKPGSLTSIYFQSGYKLGNPNQLYTFTEVGHN